MQLKLSTNTEGKKFYEIQNGCTISNLQTNISNTRKNYKYRLRYTK